jgi:dTDP-4-amino-4,6-dideoxygalactose transaminase
MTARDVVEPRAEDLRYLPPPPAPVLDLHPSRMTVARAVATGLSVLRPNLTAGRVHDRLCAWSGRAECVLTASGRTALRLALLDRGAGPGSEVVLSTFNCPAVVDAVLTCGAKPVLVDFDPVTGPAFDSVPLRGRVVVLTNGLGLDEWAAHGERITARGGTVVLDLAQAVPAPGVLRRYSGTDFPIVLSFGIGKPLGGLGGGALLTATRRPGRPGPTPGAGPATLVRAVSGRMRLDAPARVRNALARKQSRAPGWSTTKADHLPAVRGPVPDGGPSPWQQAAAAVLLDSAESVRHKMIDVHDRVRTLLHESLRACELVPAAPDLGPHLDLIVARPEDRFRFGQELAARGIPATWNYYPLHRTPAYAGDVAAPEVDRLWRRVLSVPKQPQPRLTADLLAGGILAADRAISGGRRG